MNARRNVNVSPFVFVERPGGECHTKGGGMLVGNFKLNPYGRPIWAWARLSLSPKRDHIKTQRNKKGIEEYCRELRLCESVE